MRQLAARRLLQLQLLRCTTTTLPLLLHQGVHEQQHHARQQWQQQSSTAWLQMMQQTPCLAGVHLQLERCDGAQDDAWRQQMTYQTARPSSNRMQLLTRLLPWTSMITRPIHRQMVRSMSCSRRWLLLLLRHVLCAAALRPWVAPAAGVLLPSPQLPVLQDFCHNLAQSDLVLLSLMQMGPLLRISISSSKNSSRTSSSKRRSRDSSSRSHWCQCPAQHKPMRPLIRLSTSLGCSGQLVKLHYCPRHWQQQGCSPVQGQPVWERRSQSHRPQGTRQQQQQQQ